MGTEDVYEKHEERKNKLKELSQKVQYGALLGLASKLGISAEDLLRILAEVQGIYPELGRKIDLLWQIEFGTTKIQAPKPFLEPGTEIKIKRCRTYTYLSGLEHGDIMYLAINHRDVLPDCGESDAYDHSMDPIRDHIDEWATTYMRRKDKAMELVKALQPSISTHYGDECPASRYYEFELEEIQQEGKRYQLVYMKGKFIKLVGNIPQQEIAEIDSLLKKIGTWEE